MESSPAFSARVLGIVSSDLANASTTSCSLPSMARDCSLIYLLTCISIAPPPATISLVLVTLLMTWIASLSDLSASAVYCWLPPRRIMVDVLFGGWWKKFHLSEPICFSSNLSHVPRIALVRPLHVVCITALDALASLCKSSNLTLPAQNIPLSAKYCVAKSPIGNLDRTILQPRLAILSNFS